MEWIILVVLAPAVIVPVVLLFGFAGCADLAGIEKIDISDKPDDTPPPPPPTPQPTFRPRTLYDAAATMPAPSDTVPLTGRCLLQTFQIGFSAEVDHWIVTIRAATTLTIREATVSLADLPSQWNSKAQPASIIVGGVVPPPAVQASTGEVTVPLPNTPVVLTQKPYGIGVTLSVKSGDVLLVAFDVVGGDGYRWNPSPPGGGVGYIHLQDSAGHPGAKDLTRVFDYTKDITPGVTLIERIVAWERVPPP